ncbi:MAG: hypothetical protein ABW185_22225 [Sedimenticola sp.]
MPNLPYILMVSSINDNPFSDLLGEILESGKPQGLMHIPHQRDRSFRFIVTVHSKLRELR